MRHRYKSNYIRKGRATAVLRLLPLIPQTLMGPDPHIPGKVMEMVDRNEYLPDLLRESRENNKTITTPPANEAGSLIFLPEQLSCADSFCLRVNEFFNNFIAYDGLN